MTWCPDVGGCLCGKFLGGTEIGPGEADRAEVAKPLAEATITCDGEGVTTSDNARLSYQNLRRPIYPLERINAP